MPTNTRVVVPSPPRMSRRASKRSARAWLGSLALGTLGQLSLNLFRGRSHPRILEYIVWGGGLISLVLVITAMGRLGMRILQSIEDKPEIKAEPAVMETRDVSTV